MEEMETHVASDAQKSSQQAFLQNHLPQSPPDTPASAETASSASPAPLPAAATPVPAPAKLQLGQTDSSDTMKLTCCKIFFKKIESTNKSIDCDLLTVVLCYVVLLPRSLLLRRAVIP